MPRGVILRDSNSDMRRLLKLNLGAYLFEGGLDLVGLLLGDALLHRLGRTFDQVLGLLQAKAGQRAHFLDDLDLLVAGRGENDVEFRLLLGGSSAAARR